MLKQKAQYKMDLKLWKIHSMFYVRNVKMQSFMHQQLDIRHRPKERERDRERDRSNEKPPKWLNFLSLQMYLGLCDINDFSHQILFPFCGFSCIG